MISARGRQRKLLATRGGAACRHADLVTFEQANDGRKGGESHRRPRGAAGKSRPACPRGDVVRPDDSPSPTGGNQEVLFNSRDLPTLARCQPCRSRGAPFFSRLRESMAASAARRSCPSGPPRRSGSIRSDWSGNWRPLHRRRSLLASTGRPPAGKSPAATCSSRHRLPFEREAGTMVDVNDDVRPAATLS